MTINLDRRTALRTAAWTTPVILVAAAAPAYAASQPPAVIVAGPETAKCPGQSTDLPWTYVFTFEFNVEPATVVGTSLVINNVDFPIEKVVIDGTTVHLVSRPSTNSADAEGIGSLTYTVDGIDRAYGFVYDGSHPDHQLCKMVTR